MSHLPGGDTCPYCKRLWRDHASIAEQEDHRTLYDIEHAVASYTQDDVGEMQQMGPEDAHIIGEPLARELAKPSKEGDNGTYVIKEVKD